MTDENMDRANCQCKYCSKVPQMLISQRHGLSSARSSSTPGPSSASISAGGRAPRAPRAPRPKPEPQPSRLNPARNYLAVAVRKTRQDRDLVPDSDAHTPVTSDRENDCRAVARESKNALLRWLRPGELVWCVIRPEPIHGLIRYWPALVMEQQVKSETVTRGPKKGDGASTSRPASSGGKVPWEVRQHTEYKIQLLGIKAGHTVRDSELLPYQVYGPPNPIWDAVKNAFLGIDRVDWTHTSAYDPFLTSASVQGYRASEAERWQFSEEAFREGALPFSLAVAVASDVAKHWTPTDQLEDQIPVPSPWVQDGPIGAHDKGKSRAGGRSAAMVMRTEFQGMWWGPERIWADDLVRLKLLRSEYERMGSETVLAPAGPGPRTLRNALAALGPLGDALGGPRWESEAQMLSELGAGTRGIVMRIDSIHSFDPPLGELAQLKISGMLYELVDDDWQESMVSADTIFAASGSEHSSQRPDVSDQPTQFGEQSMHAGQPSVSISSGPTLAPNPTPPLSRPPWQTKAPLPPAPHGYRFRPILKDGLEAELPLALLAGRYYPRLHMHPALEPALRAGMDIMKSEFELPAHFQSLCGLTSGMWNLIDPPHWHRSRRAVVSASMTAQKSMVQNTWMDTRMKATPSLSDVDLKDELVPPVLHSQHSMSPAY